MPFFAKNRHIPDAFDERKHRFFFTERGIFPDFHSPSWNIYLVYWAIFALVWTFIV